MIILILTMGSLESIPVDKLIVYQKMRIGEALVGALLSAYPLE
jgi:hypothetical protein